MWPIILKLGSFHIHTMTMFVVVAFLVTAFIFWRKTKDEHYQEEEVFDALLVSGVVGMIAARVAYILTQLPVWGIAPLKWIDLSTYPGSIIMVGVVTAGWYLYRYAIKHKWDPFELLDFWTTALAAGLGVIWLGLFFDGSYIGDPTTLFFGVTFPGLFEKHHAIQLYLAAFYLAIMWYLIRLEYRYRTYAWYRGTRNTAQTGFVTCMGIMLASIGSLLVSLVSPNYVVVAGVGLDQPLALLGIIFGGILLYIRSGRSLKPMQRRFSGAS